MLMPPSTKPVSNFITIYSSTSAGGLVDTCTLDITGISPNSFTNAVIGAAVVQSTANLAFNLTLSTPLATTDILRLAMDSQFDLATVSTTIAISGYGTHVFTRSSSNTLQGQGLVTSDIPSGSQLIFSIEGVVMPFTTASAPINISVSTNGNF